MCRLFLPLNRLNIFSPKFSVEDFHILFGPTCAYVMFMVIELPSGKVNVKGVDAAPPENITQTQTGDNNLLTTLLGLICGTFCKDTPLAEIIPAPAETSLTSASPYGMSGSGS